MAKVTIRVRNKVGQRAGKSLRENCPRLSNRLETTLSVMPIKLSATLQASSKRSAVKPRQDSPKSFSGPNEFSGKDKERTWR